MKKKGDFFSDYLPGTKRLMQGDQHGRAGQDIANRWWTLAGMENPNPLPTPGIIPGAYSIPGVDGDAVWNTLNPPQKCSLLYLEKGNNFDIRQRILYVLKGATGTEHIVWEQPFMNSSEWYCADDYGQRMAAKSNGTVITADVFWHNSNSQIVKVKVFKGLGATYVKTFDFTDHPGLANDDYLCCDVQVAEDGTFYLMYGGYAGSYYTGYTGYRYLYKSTDNGQTWTYVTTFVIPGDTSSFFKFRVQIIDGVPHFTFSGEGNIFPYVYVQQNNDGPVYVTNPTYLTWNPRHDINGVDWCVVSAEGNSPSHTFIHRNGIKVWESSGSGYPDVLFRGNYWNENFAVRVNKKHNVWFVAPCNMDSTGHGSTWGDTIGYLLSPDNGLAWAIHALPECVVPPSAGFWSTIIDTVGDQVIFAWYSTPGSSPHNGTQYLRIYSGKVTDTGVENLKLLKEFSANGIGWGGYRASLGTIRLIK
jgi:hypothetical protein